MHSATEAATIHDPSWSDGDPSECTVRVDLVAASITVIGELDRERVHLFVDATTTLAATLHRSWEVDAAGISFCDAGGLRALAAAAATARRRGGELTIVGAPRSLRRLLALVELDHLLAGDPETGDRSGADAVPTGSQVTPRRGAGAGSDAAAPSGHGPVRPLRDGTGRGRDAGTRPSSDGTVRAAGH